MAEHSNIEWTDSTFNPWEGCQKVGPGCDHCYAENRNARFGGGQAPNWGPGAPRRRTSASNWAKPLLWEREHEAFMLAHGRRRRVFCASLADVFDNQVDPAWRADLFWLIKQTPNLDWLLLTKRIGNAQQMMEDALVTIDPAGEWPMPWPNVWLGATVVNQAEADRDITKLLAVPARVRFLSIEPMLGPIDVSFAMPWRLNGPLLNRSLDWVICGAESGPGARPMHPDWARSLRDQCAAAGVPFLFKQNGEFTEATLGNVDVAREDRFIELDGTDSTSWTIDRHSASTAHMVRIGKKAAGRLLDGVTHDGFPR